jgi:hypothetical protein
MLSVADYIRVGALLTAVPEIVERSDKLCDLLIALLGGKALDRSQQIRLNAANAANAEDADIWRWFASLVEDRRIRWCCADGSWLVTVDHRHVATEGCFDDAIRTAKRRGLLGDAKMRGEFPGRCVL